MPKSKLTKKLLEEIKRRSGDRDIGLLLGEIDMLNGELATLKRVILFGQPSAAPLAKTAPTESSSVASNGNGHGVEITGRLHQATALPGRRAARYITLALVTNQRSDEFVEKTRNKLSQQVTIRVF